VGILVARMVGMLMGLLRILGMILMMLEATAVSSTSSMKRKVK